MMTLFSCYFTTSWCQVSQLSTTDSLEQDTVFFEIVNLGPNATPFEFIIIQDNVLEISQGDTTIAPHDTIWVFGLSDDEYAAEFKIELKDPAANRQDSVLKLQDENKISKNRSFLQLQTRTLIDHWQITWTKTLGKDYELRLYDFKGHLYQQVAIQPNYCEGERCMYSLFKDRLARGLYLLCISDSTGIRECTKVLVQ
ncbi:MAG: hypothetical protein AAFP19_01845 [Bacteroidota bacterium]